MQVLEANVCIFAGVARRLSGLATRPTRSKSAVVVVLLLLCSSLIVAVTQSNVYGSQYVGGSGNNYVELRVVGNYGGWVAPYETTSSAISMISSLRVSTGTRPLNLYAIVSGPQDPSEYLLKSTTTLDSFLLQAQQAAGGHIIPMLNLNYYTSDLNLSLNQGQKYCDPHDKTNCGPSWFFQVSNELLSLKAISSDSHKTVVLDAWNQFIRDIADAGLPSTIPFTVLQQLKAQGWAQVMLKSPRYMSDNGNAWAQVGTPVSSTQSPYMQPDLGFLSKLPASDKGFIGFDRQIQNSPDPPTDLATFLANLTAAQQAVALTNLASLQSPDNYTFVYPVLTYTSRDSVQYIWDASSDLQKNGQPFLNLIMGLLAQYNGGGSTTTTTSTTSTTPTTSTSSTSSTTTSSTTTSSTTTSSTTTSSTTTSSTTTTSTTSTTQTTSTSSETTTSSTSTSDTRSSTTTTSDTTTTSISTSSSDTTSSTTTTTSTTSFTETTSTSSETTTATTSSTTTSQSQSTTDTSPTTSSTSSETSTSTSTIATSSTSSETQMVTSTTSSTGQVSTSTTSPWTEVTSEGTSVTTTNSENSGSTTGSTSSQTATIDGTAGVQAPEVTILVAGNNTKIPITGPFLVKASGDLASSVDFGLQGSSPQTLTVAVSIPKNLVVDGMPRVYADGTMVTSQSFSQDSTNYYVIFTGTLRTDQISVKFTDSDDPASFMPVYVPITVAATALVAGGAVSLRILKPHNRDGRQQ